MTTAAQKSLLVQCRGAPNSYLHLYQDLRPGMSLGTCALTETFLTMILAASSFFHDRLWLDLAHLQALIERFQQLWQH